VAGLRFEWDSAKNIANQHKHGVSFEEASRVFLDPFSVSVKERMDGGEQRWQTFGEVEGIVLLMVAHTVRVETSEAGTIEVMRIISARRATRRERQRYEEENS
jgi:hypothetical protein